MRKRQRYDPFADTSRDPLSSKLPRPTGGAAAARWGGSSDLSQELHALADYVAPSPEEDRARHDLVERLRDLLASAKAPLPLRITALDTRAIAFAIPPSPMSGA